mgnify:CR=1 FL=1
MIRTTLLWMLVSFLAVYAWRDWYKSLCGLILLVAVVQHPDFPNSVLGIHGLNPWNLLLAAIVPAWLNARRHEKLTFDAPPGVIVLLCIFFFFVVLAYVRMASDKAGLVVYTEYFFGEPPSQMYLLSEYIINCLKWVVPAFMLYDGCRSEQRLRLAVLAVLGVYVLLALQVIRWMPLGMLTSGDDLSERGLKILVNEIGFHRVNMSMMLAGASWALYAARNYPPSILFRYGLIFLSGVCLFALALTGGRMGLVTWALMGGIFALWKWRGLLVLGPVVLILIIALVPAARDRLMQGFAGGEVQTNNAIEETLYLETDETSWYTVTSGRTFAWPFVVAEIAKAPMFGYGRDAMIRTGVAGMLLFEYGESFPHPHNAYLQWLMDNGIVGAIPVIMLYWIFLRRAGSLFADREDKTAEMIGGICLSLLLAFLIAGIGSQTFYPREGAVGMWCAVGLALRVYRQRELRNSRVSAATQVQAV